VSEPSTLTLLRGIARHLSRRRRWQLAALLLVMLASGGAELVSLAAVLPFLAVLSDPQQLWRQPLVQALAQRAGVTNVQELLLPICLAFALAALLAAGVRLLNLWLNGRLAAAIGSDLSCEAYRRTLHQPYRVHVSRNSSAWITAISQHTTLTVVALNALLQLCTAAIVAAGLLVALLAVDWVLALASASVFASAYGLQAYAVRRRLAANSAQVAEASRQQLQALQEGLGSIRDVLLGNSQAIFLATYRQADRPMRQRQAQSLFLGALPRYPLEALGLVLIALLGWLLVKSDGMASVIPLLGTLALGAQRLLPALHQVYSGWATLNSTSAPLAAVLALLEQPIPEVVAAKALQLEHSIGFAAVNFRYAPELPDILCGLDLTIRRGELIGVIGPTGCGKSTTIDLLMGLLEPTAGRILIDGRDLHDPNHPERLAAWRATIAHVPQSIALADASICENIAFGVPRAAIDMQRVRRAAVQAQIAAWVESSDAGYDTTVGERGIRLSGGQRQRLGIARALYRQASVLVLDEATSALDTPTEEAVMAAIEGLGRDLTIVMVAHRLSTVARCDRVIRIQEGILVADGPPAAVLRS
jgi:ATP-binding cassette subfamily B protein